jgi:hypothetical protein
MQEANAMATTIDPNAPGALRADRDPLVTALAGRLAGALLPGDKADFPRRLIEAARFTLATAAPAGPRRPWRSRAWAGSAHCASP